MTEQPNGAFTGFTPDSLHFFRALAANNTKPWFEAHRPEYDKHLLQPLKALAADLADFMLSIDPDLVTVPAGVISRIHRDTRFSRDKSPYKTCLWITFKRRVVEWRDTPCYFFEITADSYRFGMGFYSASRETMDRLRKAIERNPAGFRQAAAFFERQDTFVLEGEIYRKPPKPDLPDDLQTWHRRKNLYLVCNRQPDGALFTRFLFDDLRKGFGMLAPFYEYLWTMKKPGR